jgi:hypothetical protein
LTLWGSHVQSLPGAPFFKSFADRRGFYFSHE